jgi:replicative DNA helicase
MTYSIEAEQSVLGAMLIEPSESIPLVSMLTESDFYLPEHQATFAAMVEMHKQGKPIDFVTLLERLKTDKDYLLQLAQMVPTLANTKAYAEIVRAKSQQRRITGKLQDVLFCDMEADALIPAVEKIIEGERGGTSKDVEEDRKQTLISYIDTIYKPLDRDTRIWTGYKHIDDKTGGLLKGGISCWGAPPSTGKTAIAINVVENQIKTKNRIAFFSLEMSKEQIYNRMFSSLLSIPYDSIKNKYLDKKQQQKISQSVSDLYGKKQLYLFGDIYTIEEISRRIYELKPDLVVVDFIQRVRTVEKMKDTRERINFLTAEFKWLAKKNNCHIMLLSQVSRQADKSGKPKPPRMSDLKESGNIEEDSDYIFMIFRPYVYEKSKDYTPEQTQLLIDKNKDGETGMIEMYFRGAVQRFEEVETRYDS